MYTVSVFPAPLSLMQYKIIFICEFVFAVCIGCDALFTYLLYPVLKIHICNIYYPCPGFENKNCPMAQRERRSGQLTEQSLARSRQCCIVTDVNNSCMFQLKYSSSESTHFSQFGTRELCDKFQRAASHSSCLLALEWTYSHKNMSKCPSCRVPRKHSRLRLK